MNAGRGNISFIGSSSLYEINTFLAFKHKSVLDEIGEGAVIRKFPEAFSLERALKWGAAMGTANCLNINPGFVELTVLEKIFERVVVERREKWVI